METIKVYNETWLRNLEIQKAAKIWQKHQFISQDQLTAIQQAHPQAFYRPNVFIKFGLFIFTILACGFTSGFVGLFMSAIFQEHFSAWATIITVICSIIFWFVLEYQIIQERKMLYAGVDNILIYNLVTSISTVLLAWTFDTVKLDTWLYFAVVLPVLLLATMRYAEIVVSISAYLCLLTIISLLLIKIPIGKLILPFVVMAFAGLSYWQAKKWGKKDRFFYYHAIFQVIECTALALFYCGGNYLIVREGNALINSVVSQQIAFAPLFYFFTIAIPIAFIFWGLKKHDRKLLIVGLLALVFSAYTYRTYFAVLPLEYALTLGGFLMIMVAVLSIWYLKTPRHGISYQPELSDKNLNLESILINQLVPQAPQTNTDLEFGGGQFGGAGAGDTY